MEPIVVEQILKIRDGGETNMFDVGGVLGIAIRDGLLELATYLVEHPKEYCGFILTGKDD